MLQPPTPRGDTGRETTPSSQPDQSLGERNLRAQTNFEGLGAPLISFGEIWLLFYKLLEGSEALQGQVPWRMLPAPNSSFKPPRRGGIGGQRWPGSPLRLDVPTVDTAGEEDWAMQLKAACSLEESSEVPFSFLCLSSNTLMDCRVSCFLWQKATPSIIQDVPPSPEGSGTHTSPALHPG